MVRSVTLDQAIALALLPLVLPILAILYIAVVPMQGRPFLFSSKRVRAPGQTFRLLKIRTMQSVGCDDDQSVLGGDQCWRVTRVGSLLRRSRLDELPQLFNVLKGELKFIGPRPPLQKYVRQFPDLYAHLLSETPPGITGLATVMVHRREERLLKACETAEQTEAVYLRRCIPIKARIDLIYLKRRSWRLNAAILWMTVSKLIPHRSAAKAAAPTQPVVFTGRTSNTVVVISGKTTASTPSSKAA